MASARKILASRIEVVPCKRLSNQPSHDSNIARKSPSLSVQTSMGPISAPRCSMMLSIGALAAHTSVAEVGNSAAGWQPCELFHAGGEDRGELGWSKSGQNWIQNCVLVEMRQRCSQMHQPQQGC